MTTLIALHGASVAPCAVVLPTAAPSQGTGVSAALLLGTRASAALSSRTDVDGTAVVDAAPPPRGAPV